MNVGRFIMGQILADTLENIKEKCMDDTVLLLNGCTTIP